MADRRKLAQGLMMMTPAMREDLAGREQDIQRGKTVELLRRAGKEMYENPIVNTAIGFTPGVGDVQAAGETFAALQRGAPWQETAGYAVGMLPFVPALRTTWHGSPHGFTKFDMSKIGTGEGAQAYGHGLYLAESPGTARSYQESLSTGPERFLVNGEEVLRREAKGPMLDVSDPKTAAIVYAAREGDKGARKYFKTQGGWGEKAIAELDAMKGQKITNELPGYLYKVDLPDEQIAKMLDWDKPLSQQAPEVLQALEQSPQYQHFVNINQQNPNLFQHPSEFEAKKFYGMIGESPEDASRILREQGIPGIQYLDQASRGAGEGTRNYVVFSDEIPQILERNGQPIAQALRNYEAPQAQALREAEEYGQKMLGLPPGNTPMDRAIAGGFEPTYHGSKTPELINETGYLIPGGRSGSVRSGDAYGVGAYTTTSPAEASAPVYTGEEGAVYPLMIQRQNFLNPNNLTDIDQAKLTRFAEENLLPSDKARFEAGIKQKTFTPEETEIAKEFFQNQQKNAEQFGSGYDRTKPWIDKDESGNFVINYTDFDAPISINTKQDAEKLLSAVGYDAVPSMGYSGHTLEKAGNKKWDVTNDTGVLRSQFAAFDPRYFGKPGLLLGAGGLGVYGALQGEDEYQ